MMWLYIFGFLLINHTLAYKDCRDLDFDQTSATIIYRSITDFIRTSDGRSCKVVLEDGLRVLSSGLLSTDPRAYYIRRIDLSNNQIEMIESDPFVKSGVCLVVLDLSHNQISVIKSDAFSQLPYLQKLDLSYNSIQMLNDSAFAKSNKLDFLNLEHNKLTTVANMQAFSNLTVLQLGYNELELRPSMFKNFSKLLNLDLSHNNISYIPLGLFEGVPLLDTLNLAHNNLEAFATGTFSGLKQLKILNLSFNILPTIELTNEKVFFPIAQIHTLILDGNTNVTDLNATELNTIFRSLLYLGVGNIPWTCERLLSFFKDCRKHYIDITKHVELTLHTHNIHGVQCSDNIVKTFDTTIDSLEDVAAVTPSKLHATTASILQNDNLEKLINSMVQKIVDREKISVASIVGIVCAIILTMCLILVIISIIFKERIRKWKMAAYPNGRTVTNYKNERINPCLDEAESNLVLITQMN